MQTFPQSQFQEPTLSKLNTTDLIVKKGKTEMLCPLEVYDAADLKSNRQQPAKAANYFLSALKKRWHCAVVPSYIQEWQIKISYSWTPIDRDKASLPPGKQILTQGARHGWGSNSFQHPILNSDGLEGGINNDNNNTHKQNQRPNQGETDWGSQNWAEA